MRIYQLTFEKSSSGNHMRKPIDPQMKLGAVDISQIKFDLRSRDEIPKLLMGLQYIYCTPEVKEEVFKILEDVIPAGVNRNNGRPGMELWKILVFGTLRLNCNWDYDKLHDISNNHKTLRLMLGHGIWDKDGYYALQTLKDNVSLLTPDVLDRVNQVVVKYGHKLICKKKDESLRGKCDSFVLETDVHYPTDINLLFDAIRKVITLIAAVCFPLGISAWRQSSHNTRKIKKLFRKAQNLKHSNAKNEEKKAERDNLIKEAHQTYVDLVRSFVCRVKETIKTIRDKKLAIESKLEEIEKYIAHAERQIDQIERRVVKGEKIPHDEKVFSIFEEHTEWISKGKAGVPQELGLKVCILEDQYRFILHHQVMQKQTDDQIAVSMVEAAKKKFPVLAVCSFDKGFYSKDNKNALMDLLDLAVISKKGKLSEKDIEIESDKEFVKYKRKHSAVESAINALENHGLDRCLDHGTAGFKRYVSLAVVARNIQILGTIVFKRENDKQKRIEGMKRKRQYSVLEQSA
jgi:uncharacterized protein YfkK (UPF0435 family)